MNAKEYIIEQLSLSHNLAEIQSAMEDGAYLMESGINQEQAEEIHSLCDELRGCYFVFQVGSGFESDTFKEEIIRSKRIADDYQGKHNSEVIRKCEEAGEDYGFCDTAVYLIREI